jgi:hypothetical protein
MLVSRSWVYLLITCCVGLAMGPAAQAQYEPGQRRTRDVCHLRLRCGNTGSDSGEATHQPDQGWVIVDYDVVVETEYGERNYRCDYVQPNSRLVSGEFVQSQFREALAGAYRNGLQSVAANIQNEQSRLLNRLRSLASSHRAIVLSGSIRGEGRFQGGGSLMAHVRVVEEFVGDEAYFTTRAAFWRSQVATAAPPPAPSQPPPAPAPVAAPTSSVPPGAVRPRIVHLHNATEIPVVFHLRENHVPSTWTPIQLAPGQARQFSVLGDLGIVYDANPFTGVQWVTGIMQGLPRIGHEPPDQVGSVYRFELRGQALLLGRVR